jgi:predicted Zn-dependent protease
MHSQPSVAAAVAAFQQGDLVRARQLAEEQLAKAEQPPLLHHLMGLIECSAGRMEAGVEWLQRASQADSGNIGFRVMLVRALIDTGRAADALAVAEPPRGSTPSEIALWHARAEAADKADDAEASLQAWQIIASAHRSDWRAWCNVAEAAARLERWTDAATALERAAALKPTDAAIGRALGTALANLGRLREALATLKKAATLDPGNLQGRVAYARLLRDTGQYREAMVEIEEGSRLALERALQGARAEVGGGQAAAISISPDQLASVRELGLLLDRSNQVEGLRRLLAAAGKAGIAPEALGYLEASMALREGRPEEAKRLLLHDRQNIDDAQWYRMKTRIADALDDPDEAFAAAEEMNRVVPGYDEWRRRAANYREQIRAIAEGMTPQWASRIQPIKSDDDVRAPAFLVGFPRSGTTLLDTFLMGHPQTCVVEEGKMLERAAKVVSDSPHDDWPRDVLMAARKAYIDDLSDHVPPDFNGLVVDKHPLNMLRLAIIHALFPGAKVIFAQRHPCDVVLSGFLQSFQLNHAMACFLDLADAADFYDATMTLWTRAHDAVPQAIHSVVYERLIADPAAELRPVVEFLGLDWSDQMLDHQATAKSRGSVITPSYDQIVQPLSAAPSGRWRRYEKQLEPVLPVLLPWAERLGYTS